MSVQGLLDASVRVYPKVELQPSQICLSIVELVAHVQHIPRGAGN